jgi:predicted pyridoxine 5'-phosphate oxidase superfamily flavin-nucleotide-binding protein
MIPESFRDLVERKRAFAALATVNADGTPQVTRVWIDWDGTHPAPRLCSGLAPRAPGSRPA